MTELMKHHVSIRKFKDAPVPQEMLIEILEAAKAASTSSFLQAYSILVVSDKSPKRGTLAQLCGEQAYVQDAPVFLVFLADLHRLHLMCDLHGATYSGGWTENLLIATVDAALAGQNALLAAESMGLGGVYIGGIRNNIEAVCQLLDLPEEVYPVFGMCLGYPDQSPGTKERMPNDLLVHWDTYQAPDLESLKTYDEKIRDYYSNRTGGKVKTSWSEGVADRLSKEMRPHMKAFLEKRGFMLR